MPIYPAIDVRMNVKQITRSLTNIQREQIPFSMSQAMWETTALAKTAGQRSMRKHLSNPRPQTVNSMRNWAPGKGSVFRRDARVYFPKFLAQELGLQVYGGTVDRISDADRTIITPVNADIDEFGNVEGFRGKNNVLKRLRQGLDEMGIEYVEVPLGREAEFSNLPAGIYERVGFGEHSERLIMLFKYSDVRTYKRIWPFDEIILEQYRRHFGFSFAKFLSQNIQRNYTRNGVKYDF